KTKRLFCRRTGAARIALRNVFLVGQLRFGRLWPPARNASPSLRMETTLRNRHPKALSRGDRAEVAFPIFASLAAKEERRHQGDSSEAKHWRTQRYRLVLHSRAKDWRAPKLAWRRPAGHC